MQNYEEPYFVGRAEKKGPEHKTKLKGKARSVGKKLPGLLKEAGKVVLS